MTENCPKLFTISVNVVEHNGNKAPSQYELYSFGLGFAGSTLVGICVKEMLSTFLGRLRETSYYDVPDYPFEKKVPTLYRVAQLAKIIAEKYIQRLGVCFPSSAKCELLIFGYCRHSQQYCVYKLCNTPQNVTEVIITEHNVSNENFVVLGDQVEQVADLVSKTRQAFVPGTLNWWRAPFIALANIIRKGSIESIGGHLQFCMANQNGARLLYMCSATEDLDMSLVGFDLIKDTGFMLGGFTIDSFAGMMIPGENGWNQHPTMSEGITSP